MTAIATTPTLERDVPSHLGDPLLRYVLQLVQDAQEEVFEDGMESNFSRGLVSVIQEHGNAVLTAIEDIILDSNTNVELQGETLIQLGAIDSPGTHNRRLTILTGALESKDVRVRDAASLALETMEDASAIPALESALRREQSARMQQNLKAVITQLRESA